MIECCLGKRKASGPAWSTGKCSHARRNATTNQLPTPLYHDCNDKECEEGGHNIGNACGRPKSAAQQLLPQSPTLHVPSGLISSKDGTTQATQQSYSPAPDLLCILPQPTLRLYTQPAATMPSAVDHQSPTNLLDSTTAATAVRSYVYTHLNFEDPANAVLEHGRVESGNGWRRHTRVYTAVPEGIRR